MEYFVRCSFAKLILFIVVGMVKAQDVVPFPPPPHEVSSVATLVTSDEPGERLVITGIVYTSDGKTPYPDFILYLYQTDATGVYNMTDRSWMRPRIRGWVRTDKDGKYEIRTVKPGSYPGSRNPAHIHAIVKLPGNEPDWIDDFLFEDDPFLTERERNRAASGDFSHIMRATRRADGTLVCTRNIKLSVR
jgi:protocatechuate 3,4-dioxygenase beta subunit